MRFGLIGCGDIGRLRAEALNQAKDCQLVSVNDLDEKRAAEFAHTYHTSADRTWHELIHREDVEVVIVSTPPALHAEMCIAALEAGKHVLCEKPLTRTVEEGRQVIAAAEKSGKFLATGFNYRFYPSMQKARELLKSGIIGDLDHIRSYAGYTAADHNHDWLHDPAVVGGGALRDNGIHLIDLTHNFLEDVVDVMGFATNGVWGFPGCEDNGFALLRNSKGRVATLQASWTEWNGYRFAIDIYGTRGAIHASCFPMLTQVTWSERIGGKTQSRKYSFPEVFIMEHLRSYRWVVTQSFMKEHDALRRAILGEKSEIATGLDGLKAIEIAQAASAYSEQTTRLVEPVK